MKQDGGQPLSCHQKTKPALLWGVALGNLVKGVPIDAEMNYVGGFFNLLNGYALLGGAAALLVFTLHGAIFLALKTSGDLMESARQLAARLWVPATYLAAVFPVIVLSGLVLFTAPLIPVFMVLIGSLTDRVTKQQWRNLSRLSAHFLDVVQGMP